jgi:hypothetical protein
VSRPFPFPTLDLRIASSRAQTAQSRAHATTRRAIGPRLTSQWLRARRMCRTTITDVFFFACIGIFPKAMMLVLLARMTTTTMLRRR